MQERDIKNLFWITLSCVLLAAGFFLPGSSAITLNQLLEQTRGEHWYRLEFSNQNIGQYQSSTQTSVNEVAFFSSLNFTLPGAASSQINESLVFEASPPYALLSGDYSEITRNNTFREITLTRSKTKIEHADVNSSEPHDNLYTYTSHILEDGQSRSSAQHFQYTLRDHLDLELWLKSEKPAVGRTLRTRHFDFNKFRPNSISWRVVENSATAYVVSTSNMLDDSVYTLDKNFLPQSFSLAGLFKLYRISPAQASVTKRTNMVRSEYLHVAVSNKLGDPKTISQISIEIDPVSAKVLKGGPANNIVYENGTHILKTHNTRLLPARMSQEEKTNALSESLLYPIHHPDIQALAQKLALNFIPDAEKLERLLAFVNGHLRYEERTKALTLINALKSQSGDCTEYADLLTTLARHYGLPAQTVTGLAYSDSPTPGFFVHAWNRVMVDGNWHIVDPTWNEMAVDATHIAFPMDDIAQLKAYASIPAMRFKIRSFKRDSLK